jgi:putative transposase
MIEAVKVALDPTPRQARMLLSHAGAAHFAYNAGLAHVKGQLEAGERPGWSHYALRRWWNRNKDALAPWWADSSKEAYSYGLECLSRALKAFFDARRGRRRGMAAGFPRFKGKARATPRFAYTTGSFGLVDNDPKALRLPRIGRVHCIEDVARRVGGAHVTRMTVSCRAGRWSASLTVERPDATSPPPKGPSVGVDLGISHLATLSDGTAVENPKHYQKSLRRLRRAQRGLSRRQAGSKRRSRAKRRVQRLQARVANQRHDQMHKLTAHLARTHSEISIEDLNVAGMVANHNLAQAIEDASFGEFRRELGYKCARSGCVLHVVDRFYPSSRTCSACGAVKAKLPLSMRTYRCGVCGLAIDRDLNAAINIMVAGSAPETLNARGGDVRPRAHLSLTQTPAKREPGGRASAARPGAGGGNPAMQARTS